MKINKEKLIASLVYWGIFIPLLLVIFAVFWCVEYVLINYINISEIFADIIIIVTLIIGGVYFKYKYPNA